MIQRNLLGINIYDTDMTKLIHYLNRVISDNSKKIIFGISTAAYGRLKFRKDLFGIYQRMDILVAEGRGVPLFARMFGIKIREQIGMVNLTYKLLELANEHQYKVLLFGSDKETNQNAGNYIHENYPHINIGKGIDGYFQEKDLNNIVEKINSEEPHILLIGITYPIKERFSVKYKGTLDTNLIVPCGGAFEVMAGKAKRPSFQLKYIPTTWFIRFIQEPVRLFKPIIVTMLYTVLWVFPILYFKHITHIKRNPSIGDFFHLTGNEWDPETGKVKE